MAVDDRLSDLLVDWEQSRRSGVEPSLEELCRDTPELLPVLRESIDSLRATQWMLEPQPSAPSVSQGANRHSDPAAFHDTELPASHLTAQEFAASIFQSGLLSKAEIAELRQRLDASSLPGEAREIASKLVTEGKLTRYQAAVLLKASKDPLLIDNYVILDTLDTGGMGLVFKALHRSMNRVVALKLLPASMMSARDTVKRFQREVQAAASLKHPNIVAAYDADESDEVAYLVLEYVEGINLHRLVKDQGPRSLTEAASCVCQAARGLAYLHSRSIIHRDVKPANLILANDGTVKLLDMGLVRFATSEDLSCSEMDQELTQAGIVIGTVAYMSPEQALDTRSADQRSDIYSLGCTLYFLLTGRSLYHEETGMKTLLAHREQPVPSIREFCEEAPVSLDAVFRTMVAKRPADRLQSMEEVIAAVEACVPGLAATGERTTRSLANSSMVRPPIRPKSIWQSRRLRLGLSIATIAAALAATIYAVIVIRIRTKDGTVEYSTKDPNPKIEIINQPEGQPTTTAPGDERKIPTVDLGQFKTGWMPSDTPGKEVAYEFYLVAQTTDEAQPVLAGTVQDRYSGLIEAAVNSVAKTATTEDFRRPGLDKFQKRLTTAIIKVLPKDSVVRVRVKGYVLTERRTAQHAVGGLNNTERGPVPVVTATVRKGDFKVYLNLAGNAVASETVTIRPRVDGEITNVYFRAGQAVHAGDLLFDIDSRPYQARFDEERAQIARDEASLAQDVKALDRGRKLEKANEIGPQALDALVAAVDQTKGAIQKDHARIEEAKLQLDYCHIKAPITGRIGLRIVEKGNVVRAAGDSKLAEIVQVQPIDVVFPIPQDQIENISSDKVSTVEILNRDQTATIATGKLTGLDNVIDPTTGALSAKARFANADNRLLPGEFVRVRLLVNTLHDVFLVPTSAIQNIPNLKFVFVVKPDETVERRIVVTGPSTKDQTVVEIGLEPGEIVVVQGAHKLDDGSKVELPKKQSDAGSRAGNFADAVRPNAATSRAAPAADRESQIGHALSKKNAVAELSPDVTATGQKGDFKVRLFPHGNVRASRAHAICSRVNGKIAKVYVKQGQLVHAGDPLFDIDDRAFQTRLEESRAKRERDKALLTQARQDFARAQKARATKPAVSQEELDSRAAAVGQAIAQVSEDQSAVDDAKRQVSECRITAPITGRVGLRIPEARNQARAVSYETLAEIVQSQPINVVVPLPQSEARKLRQKVNSGNETTAEAFDPDDSTPLGSGKLVEIDKRADKDGNVLSLLTFENQDDRLYPGQTVNVAVTLETLHDSAKTHTAGKQKGTSAAASGE